MTYLGPKCIRFYERRIPICDLFYPLDNFIIIIMISIIGLKVTVDYEMVMG